MVRKVGGEVGFLKPAWSAMSVQNRLTMRLARPPMVMMGISARGWALA